MIEFFKRLFRGIRKRIYAAARFTRLTSDWLALGTSADAELHTSLRAMRARSRQVIRDIPLAKNAQRVVVNNVVGSGIGMQSQVMSNSGILNERVNEQIERAWERWCEADHCHTAGKLNFSDMLRMIVGQLVESGEVLVRKIRRPFGKDYPVPFALEIVEADQLADEYTGIQTSAGHTVRLGVEVDEWNRPVAYHIYPNHPGDINFRHVDPSTLIQVPADDVFHLYVADRFPQTRGVPMLHAVLDRINDLGAYSQAEIVAARASANIVGFVKTPEPLGGVQETENGERLIDSEPGTFRTLLPGEDFVGFNPSRPNTGMEAFIRLLQRDIASGLGISYESLSKDYSQSNYSSSRLSLLDDRDRWRVFQQWLIRNFLDPVFKEWMTAAVLSGELNIPTYYTNPGKFNAVHWKPRGWSWIDPTKEVEAYIKAVGAGFMTISDVIALTGAGSDAEDVFKARKAELALLASMGLKIDTAGTSGLISDEDKQNEEEPTDE